MIARKAVGHWLAVLLVCGAAAVPAAEPVQSLDAIEQAVSAFLRAETAGGYLREPVIEVGRLDPRLRLAPCDLPLETFLPRGGKVVGHVSVGVRCPGVKPWTIYVQAQVRPLAPVVVTRKALPRGTLLGSADIELVEQDLSRLTTGYLADLDAVIGMKLRRSVRAGLPLNDSLLEAPVAVRRGERVIIVARGDGLEVRMEGEALADGAPGAVIPVRNRSSGLEIEAEVVGPGAVQVRM